MAKMIENRSDKYPGIYICIECGAHMHNLMEAWRKTPDPQTGCSLSTLFCATCAQKLNGIGAELGPMVLTKIEKLNLGIPLENT